MSQIVRKFNHVIYEEDKSLARKSKERRNTFLIFIGGMPRSGTTLMRTMLDAHPDIRCGPETWVIQEILNYEEDCVSNKEYLATLTKAGVHPTALDSAVAQFILEIIFGHGPRAKYYCNKDPYTASHAKYLRKLFPNSKHIFMIRDGRAFAHSVITRKILIKDYDLTSYRDVLLKWSIEISKMYLQCLQIGEEFCLPVKYEQLVLQPVETTKKIFKFLGVPWNSDVLHHEDHLNRTILPEEEYSTSQVSKPLNLEALTSWCGEIPEDVERDLYKIAPFLKLLGYDPAVSKPNYGEPDEFVKAKLKKEEENKKKKESSKQ